MSSPSLTGTNNTAMGGLALSGNTTGSNNSAIGYEALFTNTSGAGNVAIGPSALLANTSGTLNVAIGGNALGANTIGFNNMAVGANAMQFCTTGSNNVALGSDDALQVATNPVFNVAYRNQCSRRHEWGTTRTIGIGFSALFNNTTGANNIAIGFEAGYNSGTSLQTNSACTFIGNAANSSVDGSSSNATAIGNGAAGYGLEPNRCSRATAR